MPRRTIMRDGPHPCDLHVGGRIKLRRVLLGLSQEKVATQLGLSFQQLQKYEKGVNRVAPSRLWQLGQILDVPISFFYDGYPPAEGEESPQPLARADRLTLETAKALDALPRRMRRAVLDLVRASADVRDDA